MKTEITLKTEELKLLLLLLAKFSEATDKKFAYFILRNSHLIRNELAALVEVEEQLQGTEEFQKFNSDRQELVTKYQKTSESGEPLFISERSPDFGDDIDTVNTLWNELQTKYKDAIIEYNNTEIQYNTILASDISVTIIQTSFTDIPDDIIEAKDLELFKYLIKETDDELDELLFA